MNHKYHLLALALALLLVAAVGCGSTKGDSSAAVSSASSSGGDPGYDYSAGLTDKGFFEGVNASKIVTLPDYKGITVAADLTEAKDEDVQAQLDNILANYTTYDHITDRAVKDGDTVNIDYVGTVDGVEFSGGNTGGQGTNVTVGTTQYIDDFIDQLIGHKPGETFDVNVTFPDPYESNADLSGKDAVFSTTINYIQGAGTTPELTDEIAKDYDFDSADALKEDIRTWLVEQQKSEYVSDLLSTATCDKIPDSVMAYTQDTDLAYYQNYADSYGMDLDTFFSSYMGYDTAAAYLEAQQETYQKNATFALAVQAIAEKEKLSVSDAQIKEFGYTDYEKTYGTPYIHMYALQTNVVPDFIFDNAVTK